MDVITPSDSPDPHKDEEWVFGDDEHGILTAVEKGATHLWANTVLFANHPLQTSSKLDDIVKNVKVIGQPPKLVEIFDDKYFVNDKLRAKGTFTLPDFRLIRDGSQIEDVLSDWNSYPVVGKPVRGRGSHGVKVCQTQDELRNHCQDLVSQQSSVIVEQYLQGEEATITVMPPPNDASPEGKDTPWAMPVVKRFDHMDGIAPYNGIVAVTQNSRVVSKEEHENDKTYQEAQRQCIEVARLLNCTAPMRIDVRRFTDDKDSAFALFDVNVKPNMTGPGRPGRDDQACLTAIAAAGIGWDYATLLENIVKTGRTLEELRNVAKKASNNFFPPPTDTYSEDIAAILTFRPPSLEPRLAPEGGRGFIPETHRFNISPKRRERAVDNFRVRWLHERQEVGVAIETGERMVECCRCSFKRLKCDNGVTYANCSESGMPCVRDNVEKDIAKSAKDEEKDMGKDEASDGAEDEPLSELTELPRVKQAKRERGDTQDAVTEDAEDKGEDEDVPGLLEISTFQNTATIPEPKARKRRTRRNRRARQ
ncbi:glutathione synthetase atp-binding domain-like protein [Stemphylium lycopersici]|uniref:Glutathione synthetase atp-binding domain-like protein n=1 Tax=Stemphylium lycopersici TaxID=183478 RepID=A0A364NDM6_STELY|nr:glutathione synthetase atp-binding domain-like protein [Stemphylium lycopersici]RAR15307.1 glutathione synthetase atp-binding domain-like protein [Stemphylium lycopersici]